METETIIEAKDLSKKFGDFTAVDHLNFEVYKGEIFGFLGANGAGKTTAMRMLCGLLSPSEGSATVAGFKVGLESEYIKKNIGYMSQKFSLYEDLTVFENLKLYSGIYGVPKQEIPLRIGEKLKILNFSEQANALVSDLPLGWKQKLSFICATIHNPQVLFLDEPTGGVDPVTRRQFWELIYQAAAEDISVFVTTHYMDEAEYCNRVCIMVDGQIADLDAPKKLKQKYHTDSMEGVFEELAKTAKRS